MATTHHVYLVPGFFGFANLGEFFYFGHLVPEIERLFAEFGEQAQVVRVHTHPTASVRERARRLFDTIEQTCADDGPIHLIGHSAGGLDARLVASPGARLRGEADFEPFGARLQSVLTVATPNHGTPLASFLSELSGRRFLWLLSLTTLYGLRFGHVPLAAALKIGSMVTALDKVGLKPSMVDQLFNELLTDFSSERRDAVKAFFDEVRDDQALVLQLGVEAMDLFNAGILDRPGTRYGSVVTMARPPDVRGRLASGLSAYAQATRTIYAFLYRRTGFDAARLPELSPAHASGLVSRYGQLPGPSANDGIVPTRSQPWGHIVDAVRADHLDVIGHFDAPRHDPPHMDWLATGSGYTRDAFDETWRRVVQFLLRLDEAPASTASDPEGSPR